MLPQLVRKVLVPLKKAIIVPKSLAALGRQVPRIGGLELGLGRCAQGLYLLFGKHAVGIKNSIADLDKLGDGSLGRPVELGEFESSSNSPSWRS